MKTRITELLGIKYPIVQAGMGWVSYLPLVVAVSNAGGLGILSPTDMTPEELRQDIRKVRELTDNKPFAVNVVPYLPGYRQFVEVIVEENIPILSHGLANPFEMLASNIPSGMIRIPTVGSVKQAVRAEQDGADALIVSGEEGGGHCSYTGTLVLIRLVAERVKIPIIAAGGFGDGRGLVAALALGAEGISMGTRFAITRESPLPENIKRLYLEADVEAAATTTRVTGFHCRGIKGEKLKNYKGWMFRPWEVLPSALSVSRAYKTPLRELISTALEVRQTFKAPMTQFICGIAKIRKALIEGDEKNGYMPCGQVCGMINDIPTCQELIERIVSEAEDIIEKTRAKVFSDTLT